VSFSCTTMPRLTGTCNPEDTGLPGLSMSWSPTLFSGSGQSDYHLFPGLKKVIERSPFLFRSGGHCCRGDLVGRTTFWSSFSGLQKIEEETKKFSELRSGYVE
jgi:hypothetical protein